MKVVVVESPAKAKTINKYLGSDYHVLASYGHVRDLPPKDGSVDPAEDFAMVWQVEGKSEQRIKDIQNAVKGADTLILATDPDREGEAISWHLAEELTRRKVLKNVAVQRVVFNEVTKSAVLDAFNSPRELNRELIDAYLARRALDYLVGFTLSPVLWRKLPGSKSAGRVQSVALRLICEREAEIEVFKPREYWSVTAKLRNEENKVFSARLTHLDGNKLDRFDLPDEATTMAAVRRLEDASSFTVQKVERKQVRRNPHPPFTTSTLQQEASRKLGFGATRTMRTAQKLYEGLEIGGETVGLITYMRTDGVSISAEAVAATRDMVGEKYGQNYLPDAPRVYKSKAKNAQEAHEAVRPTDVSRHPSEMKAYLDSDGARLYELIWNRTVASQMESARFDQVSVDIDVDVGQATLRATGSILTFDGFLKLYQEGKDDQKDANAGEQSEDDDKDRRLPKLTEGDRPTRDAIEPEQHFTQPPPRYSEASLVKKMEELGIGRPSTYASIIQVLQDRNYVVLDKRRFVPEDRGRLVVAFLSSFFERYVQYNFTAELEEQLDDISGGRIDWKIVLRSFWDAFNEAVGNTKDLTITEVIDALDEDLGPHFFPVDPKNPDKDPRLCPTCSQGRLGLRLGRNGGFIGCSNYPECRFTRALAVPGEGEDGENGEAAFPRVLGKDPETGLEVSLRKGPYGIYAQLGEPVEKEKPKRASLPKGLPHSDVTLEVALGLLSLPRDIGPHPEDGEMITAGIGRFGPYVKHGKTYRSISNDDDVLTVGLNRAVSLIAEAPARRGAAEPLRVVGEHPDDKEPINLFKGRYGPYVKHGKLIASLPKTAEMESFTLEAAVELLKVQAEKAKTKKGGKKAPVKKAAAKKKAPAKKTAAKKTAAKKPAAKKATTKKKAPAKTTASSED
ncbi:type I DNA topoisomerase [Denitrobaculum tricleocarpae]|uniref:DNA topoisomerase 1 n=1 Tax=Denitrobaculum tricleocarpae TaxID=2591009 RepID=A0A545TTV1_9PROT|nr:type I DNA topoisomerase [Denitrobaculum tricleocarpae]TQV80643.1 type I DNA topoisomerase [Denitrobaculum tricleocarpae]